MSTSPDLVRVDVVRHEKDEDFEGAVGFLIDTDIDNNGHGVYTVHIPAQNVDVQAREIEVISGAQTAHEVAGKCSVPMWTAGCPDGFCDQAAYGKRPQAPTHRRWDGFEYRDDGLYTGYVPGLACPMHGGPKVPPANQMSTSELVWVHLETWAGHRKMPGFVEKRNPKRSRVNYKMPAGTWVSKLVPNHAITPRVEDQLTGDV